MQGKETATDCEEKGLEGELFREFLENGKQEAYEQLYAKYEPRIRAFCLRILRNEEDARDALQETFYHTTKQNSFSGNAFSSWLYRVALNVCRKFLRSQTSRRNRERKLGEEFSGSPAPTPSEVYSRKVTEQQVSQAIDQLPEKYRTTIVLKYIDDLSAPQIAEIMALPLTTVEGRLHQGLVQLRRILHGRTLI